MNRQPGLRGYHRRYRAPEFDAIYLFAQLRNIHFVIHQASFLAGSMREGRTMDWRRAAGWLVRACRAYRCPSGDCDDEDEALEELDGEAWHSAGLEPRDGEGCPLEVWEVNPDGVCRECAVASSGTLVCADSAPELSRLADVDGDLAT